MFPYASVYVPWTAMILCEIALFVLLRRNSENNRYRGFQAYITTTVVVSVVLLAISFTGHGGFYFRAYYLGAFVKALALAAAVLEQYRMQFFPRWSMSHRAFKILMGSLAAIVLGSLAMVAYTPQQTPIWELAWARRILSLNDYLLCGSMGLLLIYGELLKVQRPQRSQAIVRGLVATGILGVTASLMLSVSGTARLVAVVGFSTTIGFVAVLISWIVAFRKPEPVVESSLEDSPLDALERRPALSHAIVSQMLMWKL